MANALTFDTSRRPVISVQYAPLYVVEQADTYFWALVLARLTRDEGASVRDGIPTCVRTC